MQKKSISEIKDLSGKRVLVRVDFNVPLDENLEITDDIRIKSALPTINYLKDAGAKVILISHLGRPKGEKKSAFSLKPVAKRLGELLGKAVPIMDDCIGQTVLDAINNSKNSDVILLENVRFYKEETTNDDQFAKQLADLADIFVSDAFGTVHRAHASTAGVAQYLPSYAGFLIEKELEFLGGALNNPKRPFVAIIGGAKVSSKISVLKNLINQVDTLLIGGGMSYTFFKSMGYEVGKSILEMDFLEEAQAILKLAKEKGVALLLPEDVVIADDFSNDANTKTVLPNEIISSWEGLDIGTKTAKKWDTIIKDAGTVFWNGPVGAFEMDSFATGTKNIAISLAESSAISVIGGGDSAAAIKKFGLEAKISHISTGGGASLEFLEGKVLPGIDVLQDK